MTERYHEIVTDKRWSSNVFFGKINGFVCACACVCACVYRRW